MFFRNCLRLVRTYDWRWFGSIYFDWNDLKVFYIVLETCLTCVRHFWNYLIHCFILEFETWLIFVGVAWNIVANQCFETRLKLFWNRLKHYKLFNWTSLGLFYTCCETFWDSFEIYWNGLTMCWKLFDSIDVWFCVLGDVVWHVVDCV